MGTDMLRLAGLHAYYGKSHILHGVDMTVGEGEIVSLLGRNGSGRSTTVQGRSWAWWRARARSRFRGQEILGHKAFEIAHRGIGYVPENRDIFPKLTVEQNLRSGRRRRRRRRRRAGRSTTCTRMFPRLKERQHTEAGVLSGGEQQMLTLCRTLMGDPDLIMIDEPTEGLAPKIVELVAELPEDAEDARRLGAAGRAEADDRARDLRALLRDGPRRDRLRGHARRAARERRDPQGVARGLSGSRFARPCCRRWDRRLPRAAA